MSKKELLAVAGGFVAGIAAVGLFRSLKKKEERKIDSPEGMDEDFDLEEIWDEELDEEYDPEKDSLLKNPGSEQKAYCDELEDKLLETMFALQNEEIEKFAEFLGALESYQNYQGINQVKEAAYE